jgi:hypothetical protein
MKLVHRLLNTGWFHVLAASFGLVIHDQYPTRSARGGVFQLGRQAGHMPRWGLVLYGFGISIGLVGIVLNFSGFLPVGTWLIGVAIVLVVSTALQLGHLKKW